MASPSAGSPEQATAQRARPLPPVLHWPPVPAPGTSIDDGHKGHEEEAQEGRGQR
eukprot:CAMPEP_0168458704 /NCGR_PEP_ID=MMETSP0228-20121227/52522_1 /TAXON_ID=133427 /ORGANISM="Protoceratium reticulatum, Strain CCCM 535 (=CCMP 1889)" /LENGTH=54 /DNA_ID=CAMNT_0008473827 /DNA_START=79 /DNA_END=239 /DNA_ORIENTATION=-